MTERDRALANARTAWSIESWHPEYFAWKELALELATFVLSLKDEAEREKIRALTVAGNRLAAILDKALDSPPDEAILKWEAAL